MPNFLLPTYPPPGTPVFVPVAWGLFRHLGIVTERWVNGSPTIVSRSRRAGYAVEESWDDFSDGQEVLLADLATALPPWEVVARARALLGTRWDLLTANCDHLVREALGLPVTSPQLWGAAGVLALGALVGVGLRDYGRMR